MVQHDPPTPRFKKIINFDVRGGGGRGHFWSPKNPSQGSEKEWWHVTFCLWGSFWPIFLLKWTIMIRKLIFCSSEAKKRARARLYDFCEFEPLTRLLDRHDISIRKRLGPSHARHVTFFSIFPAIVPFISDNKTVGGPNCQSSYLIVWHFN